MSQEVGAAPAERPPSKSDAPRGDAAAEPDGGGRRRRWPWLSLLLAVAIGAAAVLGVGFGRDPRVVESVLLDRPAPALDGRTLEGGVFGLDDHRGEVVVVNVWASWCTVCKEEHPDLEAAARRLAPHGVRFVGLNTQTPSRTSARSWRRWAAHLPTVHPMLARQLTDARALIMLLADDLVQPHLRHLPALPS